jgi:hypothetical protein
VPVTAAGMVAHAPIIYTLDKQQKKAIEGFVVGLFEVKYIAFQDLVMHCLGRRLIDINSFANDKSASLSNAIKHFGEHSPRIHFRLGAKQTSAILTVALQRPVCARQQEDQGPHSRLGLGLGLALSSNVILCAWVRTYGVTLLHKQGTRIAHNPARRLHRCVPVGTSGITGAGTSIVRVHD